MHSHPRGRLALLLIGLATLPLSAQAPRGVQLFDAGDWAAAKAEFAATIQRSDRDARAHYYLGRLALLDDDADAAEAQFERAVALDETVSDYHLWYGTALSQQAGRASKLKQPFIAKRVLSEFERAVALDPRSIEARDSLVDFYSMAPGFMGGGADKARDQAQALAGIDAARGHLAFARLAIAAKDTSTAEREMQAAIASAPDTFRPYSALANWYAKDKRWPEAFAALEPYIKKHPDDPYGPYGIGRIAALSGQQLDRGEKGIRTFIAKPPKDAGALVLSGAYRRLGLILEFEGKHAEARSAIEHALIVDPRNEEAKKAMK
jgi:tetratricopeptide (TPR) repeat protein